MANNRQTILLTAHKGVDLHAASALRVMKTRLEGGQALVRLFRCETHILDGETGSWNRRRLLDTGRFYNPNKHHYGLFEGGGLLVPVDGEDTDGAALPDGWPGEAVDSDLPMAAREAELYDALLGGVPGAGQVAVDVLALPRGEADAVRSGVLWRLVLAAAENEALALGRSLAVARGRKRGLLLNPHMETWRLALRRTTGSNEG